MIDLLQIANEATGLALNPVIAAAGPVEKIASYFHVEWQMLVAQIVAILMIFAAFYFLAWKKVLGVIDERRDKIADGIQYAEEMKTKLAESERQQTEAIKEAALEAKAITEQAQKTAKEIVEKTQAEAQRKAEEIIAQTRENLTLERKQMVAEVKEHASKMVAVTTAKVLSRELDDNERARFVEAAAEEISK